MTTHIRTHDWPTTGRPVDPNAVTRVLARFDDAYPVAVAQLAATRLRSALVPARHPGARPTGTGWPA